MPPKKRIKQNKSNNKNDLQLNKSAKIKKCFVLVKRVNISKYVKNAEPHNEKEKNNLNILPKPKIKNCVVKIERIILNKPKEINKITKTKREKKKFSYQERNLRSKIKLIDDKSNDELVSLITKSEITNTNNSISIINTNKKSNNNINNISKIPKAKPNLENKIFKSNENKSEDSKQIDTISNESKTGDSNENETEKENSQQIQNEKNTQIQNSIQEKNEEHLLDLITEDKQIDNHEEILVSSTTDKEHIKENSITIEENNSNIQFDKEFEKEIPNDNNGDFDTNPNIETTSNLEEETQLKVIESLNSTQITLTNFEHDEVIVSSSTDEEVTNEVVTKNNETEINSEKNLEPIVEKISVDESSEPIIDNSNLPNKTIEVEKDNSNIKDSCDEKNCDLDKVNKTRPVTIIRATCENKETQTPKSFIKVFRTRSKSRKRIVKRKELPVREVNNEMKNSTNIQKENLPNVELDNENTKNQNTSTINPLTQSASESITITPQVAFNPQLTEPVNQVKSTPHQLEPLIHTECPTDTIITTQEEYATESLRINFQDQSIAEPIATTSEFHFNTDPIESAIEEKSNMEPTETTIQTKFVTDSVESIMRDESNIEETPITTSAIQSGTTPTRTLNYDESTTESIAITTQDELVTEPLGAAIQYESIRDPVASTNQVHYATEPTEATIYDESTTESDSTIQDNSNIDSNSFTTQIESVTNPIQNISQTESITEHMSTAIHQVHPFIDSAANTIHFEENRNLTSISDYQQALFNTQEQSMQQNALISDATNANSNSNYLETSQTYNNDLLPYNDFSNSIAAATMQIISEVFENERTKEMAAIVVGENMPIYENYGNFIESDRHIQLKVNNIETDAINQVVPQIEEYTNNSYKPPFPATVLESIQIIPPFQQFYHQQQLHTQNESHLNESHQNNFVPLYQNFNPATFVCLENYAATPSAAVMYNENYERMQQNTPENTSELSRQNYDTLETPTQTSCSSFIQDNNNFDNNNTENYNNQIIESNKYYDNNESVNNSNVNLFSMDKLDVANNIIGHDEQIYYKPQEQQTQPLTKEVELVKENELIPEPNVIDHDIQLSPFKEQNKNIISPIKSGRKIKKEKTWVIKKGSTREEENYYSTKITIVSGPPLLFSSTSSSDEISDASSEKRSSKRLISSSSSSTTSSSSSSSSSSLSKSLSLKLHSTNLNVVNENLVPVAEYTTIKSNSCNNSDNDAQNDLELQRTFGILSQCQVNLIKLDLKQLLNLRSNDSNFSSSECENEQDEECEIQKEEENNIKDYNLKEHLMQQQQQFITNKDKSEELHKINIDNIENTQNEMVKSQPAATIIIDDLRPQQQQQQKQNDIDYKINDQPLFLVSEPECAAEGVEGEEEYSYNRSLVEVNSENELEPNTTVVNKEGNQVQDLNTTLQAEINIRSDSAQSNVTENENNVDKTSVSSLQESSNTDETDKENIILIPRIAESKDKLIAIENNDLLLRKEKRNSNEESNLKPKLINEEIMDIIDFDKDFEIEGELRDIPGTNNVNSIIIKRKIDCVENNENKISNSQNFLPFKKRYIPPVSLKPKKITRKKKITISKNSNRGATNKISRPIFEVPHSSQNFISMMDRAIEIEILSQAQVNEISSTQVSPPHHDIQKLQEQEQQPIELESRSEIEQEQETDSESEIEPEREPIPEIEPIHQPIPEPPERTSSTDLEQQQQQQPQLPIESDIEQPEQVVGSEKAREQPEMTPKYDNLTVDLYYDPAFTDIELLAENIVKKQLTEDLSKERKRKQSNQHRKQEKKINEFASTTASSSSSSSISSASSYKNIPGTSNIRNKNNRKKNLKTDINNVQGEKFFRAQAGINENTNDEFRTRLAETIENESNSSKKLFRAYMETKKEGISKANETINKINEENEIEEINLLEIRWLEYSLRKKKDAFSKEKNKIMDPEISSSGLVEVKNKNEKKNLETQLNHQRSLDCEQIENILDMSCNSEDLLAGFENDDEKEHKIKTPLKNFKNVRVLVNSNRKLFTNVQNKGSNSKNLRNEVQMEQIENILDMSCGSEDLFSDFETDNEKEHKIKTPLKNFKNVRVLVNSNKNLFTNIQNKVTNSKNLKSEVQIEKNFAESSKKFDEKNLNSKPTNKKIAELEPENEKTEKRYRTRANESKIENKRDIKLGIQRQGVNDSKNLVSRNEIKLVATPRMTRQTNNSIKLIEECETIDLTESPKKENKFFHHNDKSIDKTNIGQKTKNLSLTKAKGKIKKESSSIFDFSASQSSPSNSDDPTKEVIKDLIKAGKVEVVKYKKGSGKLKTKFNRKPKKKLRKVEQKREIESTPKVQKEINVDINDNFDDNLDNFDNISVHSDASVNTNTFSNLARHAIKNSVAQSPYSQLISNPKTIKDKQVLLALAKSFVRRSEAMKKTKQNTLNNSYNKKIHRPSNTQLGSASPWRVQENLPTVFNFSRNSDNLPSFSSDLIDPPSPKQNQQQNFGLKQKKSVSFNNSNIENLQPSFEKSNLIIETNPKKGKPYRSPLKQINIIDVINLPILNYNNSTPIHKPAVFNPFSPSKTSTGNQKALSFNVSTKGKSDLHNNDVTEISNLFGFDQDIGQENQNNEDGTTRINLSKQILQNKLKKLKRLVPHKKITRDTNEIPRPTRLSVNKVKTLFYDPFEIEKQQDIREMLCSTMKEHKTPNNINHRANNDLFNHDAILEEIENEIQTNENQENVGETPELFADDTLTKNSSIRTYERPKRKRPKLKANFIMFDSDSEDENYAEQLQKKKKHHKPNRKHDKELESFVSDFNSMCAEVDNYNLVIE